MKVDTVPPDYTVEVYQSCLDQTTTVAQMTNTVMAHPMRDDYHLVAAVCQRLVSSAQWSSYEQRFLLLLLASVVHIWRLIAASRHRLISRLANQVEVMSPY